MTATAYRCQNDGRAAVAVLVHDTDPPTIGAGLCEPCATCAAPGCGDLAVIHDSNENEPLCDHHSAPDPDEPDIHGPAIVLIGSDHYRQLAPTLNGDSR